MLKPALVERLNTGEEAAIRETLEYYLPFFRQQAKRKNIPDLESEFWIRCFSQLKGGGQKFENPESVTGFIKQVCRGVVPDYIAQSRLITMPTKLRRLGLKSRQVTMEFIWQGDSDEFREALYAACENEEQRAILTRRIAGQPTAEIAQALNIQRSTVYYHLGKIRERYAQT